MEQRQMLDAAPIVIGAVSIEEDSGSDFHPDTFEVAFEGGAPETELTRLVINLDQPEPGFGRGDAFFDTLPSGLGADPSAPFAVVSLVTQDPNASVQASVADGDCQLTLLLSGFRAGDKLVFSIDVDEVEVYDPDETDLNIINEGFDPINSGVEMQGSTLTAYFSAPHYHDVNGAAEFLNRYDSLLAGTGLDLPADDFGGKRDRTAGTALRLQQLPKPVTISGHVYLETDPAPVPVRDPDEQGLANVSLSLWNRNGGRYEFTGFVTSTDASGHYRFGADLGLLPGVYQVRETQPEGLLSVGAIPGAVAGRPVGAAVAGNPDVLTEIDIPLGDQHAVDYDFAEAMAASVSGFVYHDADVDGRFDPGESPLAEVELILLDQTGVRLASQTTNQDGYYEFTGLAAGEYSIIEVQPAGWNDGLDAAGEIAGVFVGTAQNPGDEIRGVRLNWGDKGVNYNFGEFQYGSIAGLVYADLDRDRQFDPHETPLSDVRVQLLDGGGQLIASTLTDRDGRYRFDNLLPGRWAVHELQPPDYFQGGQRAGTAGGEDDVADWISVIPIASGQHATEYDFCELPSSTLSGFVFQDGPAIFTPTGQPPANLWEIRDGRLTEDDARLQGVVLELRDGINGDPITADQVLPGVYPDGPIRTTSDAGGFYEFRGLPSGSYAVYEVQPAGYFDGVDTPGTTSGLAINPDANIAPWVLARRSTDPNNDAIILIPLRYGESSEDNNFSEVLVKPLPPRPKPPLEPPMQPPLPPPPLPPLATMPQRELAVPLVLAVAPPPTRFQIPIDTAGGALAYTWHLSIIDAGTPRGDVPEVAGGEAPWMPVSYLDGMSWSGPLLRQGRWTCPNDLEGDDPAGQARQFLFGIYGATPVSGDFNGDGFAEIGVFFKGEWFLDINGNGKWDEEDLWARLGDEDDLPVVGDWDGDGKDDIGIFGPEWLGDPHAIQAEPGLPDPNNTPKTRPKNVPPDPDEATSGYRLLKRAEAGRLRADLIDHVFRYGGLGDRPVAGDWNGDGIDTVGIFRDGRWWLDVDGDGRWSPGDMSAQFGDAGDLPVAGDFNGDGIDEIGVFRNGRWILDTNGNHELDAHDAVFQLGGAGDAPVVGDWDGDGVDEPGLYRDAVPDVDAQARR
jgi:protocatechuate 3,4-dioxygenase beta subunit